MTLKDGTYEYRGSLGVNIRATVEDGFVTRWERDGVGADARDYTVINFTRVLKNELAERVRLGNLLHPIKFTPASEAVYVPVTVGTAQRGHLCFSTNGSRL